MSDTAEQLFERFVDARERGESPDPADTIHAAGEREREPLAAMLALYLAGHPRTAVSEHAVAARAADPRSAPPLAWPELLPALRAETGTTRGALVRRLAELLGHPAATEQVGEHVHGLETGQLDPAGVQPPVVAALASIFGVGRGLLEAGRHLAAPGAAGSAAAFARPAGVPTPAAEAATAGQEPRVEQIDRLFGTAGG